MFNPIECESLVKRVLKAFGLGAPQSTRPLGGTATPKFAVLIRGYQEITKLEAPEWEAIPLVLRSLWMQNRLRGSRKVPRDEKLAFALTRCFDVIDWLDHDAAGCMNRLRQRLESESSRGRIEPLIRVKRCSQRT